MLVPFLLFTIVPIGYVIVLSFQRDDGVNTPAFVGFDNYMTAISDASWWQSVVTTLILAGASIVIEIPLALAAAIALNRRKLPGRGIFQTVYFLPHVLSIAVLGVVFYFLLRPIDGVINGLLEAVGLIHKEIDWLGSPVTAMASLVIVSVWAGFGLNTVFFLVGLQTVPNEVQESAALDGANAWQRFRYITLPLLAPMTRIIVMLTIAFTLRSFDLVKTLTDGGPAGSTDVMFTYIFNYFFSLDRATQFGYGSALGVIASVIIAIVTLVYLRLSRRSVYAARGEDSPR